MRELIQSIFIARELSFHGMYFLALFCLWSYYRIKDEDVLDSCCVRLEDWLLTAIDGDVMELNLGSCKVSLQVFTLTVALSYVLFTLAIWPFRSVGLWHCSTPGLEQGRVTNILSMAWASAVTCRVSMSHVNWHKIR